MSDLNCLALGHTLLDLRNRLSRVQSLQRMLHDQKLLGTWRSIGPVHRCHLLVAIALTAQPLLHPSVTHSMLLSAGRCKLANVQPCHVPSGPLQSWDSNNTKGIITGLSKQNRSIGKCANSASISMPRKFTVLVTRNCKP